MINLTPSRRIGRKRRFIIYGSLNVLISNIVLQLLLFFIPTGIATLISQVVNMVLGFILYGTKVFLVESLNKHSAIRYCLLATSLWILNWYGINIISQHGTSRNIAALILIPILAVYSYISQKFVVFSK